VPDPSVSATTADRPGDRLSDRVDDRRGDHAVPGPAIAETKRTLDATPGPRPRVPDIQSVTNVLAEYT
jgi:hypothetical protein